MATTDPASLLPHRAPLLRVDEIAAMVPAQSAGGSWRLTGDETLMAGHYPGRPALPGASDLTKPVPAAFI